jgi:hypothetical protein
VALELSYPSRFRVWALAPSGKRLGIVSSQVTSGHLTFTANVAGDGAQGARMLYEVAPE